MLKNVKQEYIISPSALDAPLDSQGQARVTPDVLHHQLTAIANRLEGDAPLSIRFAEDSDFRACRLSGLGTVFLHLRPQDKPLTVMQNSYRMAIVDHVSVPDFVKSWEELSQTARPAGETLERLYKRIGQLSADPSTS